MYSAQSTNNVDCVAWHGKEDVEFTTEPPANQEECGRKTNEWIWIKNPRKEGKQRFGTSGKYQQMDFYELTNGSPQVRENSAGGAAGKENHWSKYRVWKIIMNWREFLFCSPFIYSPSIWWCPIQSLRRGRNAEGGRWRSKGLFRDRKMSRFWLVNDIVKLRMLVKQTLKAVLSFVSSFPSSFTVVYLPLHGLHNFWSN